MLSDPPPQDGVKFPVQSGTKKKALKRLSNKFHTSDMYQLFRLGTRTTLVSKGGSLVNKVSLKINA